MKILALDTTTDFLTLGLSEGQKIYEYRLEAGRKMSLLLAQTIKRSLDTLGWKVEDIDYFACGLGPGSFTGVRMGLSTIKALAWPGKKPVAGICTLDIIAAGISPEDKTVFTAVDAKRGLIYCSAYKNGLRVMPYKLLALDEFLRKLKPGSIITGDASALYREAILRKAGGITIADKDYWYLRAGSMISLARERIRKKRCTDIFKVLPVYLYPKECQIRKAR